MDEPEKLYIAPTLPVTREMLAAGDAVMQRYGWHLDVAEYREAALCAAFLAMWRLAPKD